MYIIVRDVEHAKVKLFLLREMERSKTQKGITFVYTESTIKVYPNVVYAIYNLEM